MSSPPLLIIAGPTASGKSALAYALCLRYPFEIITVDSAQVYCDMNIGTAKPSLQELATIPHHLINLISPEESYSTGDFQRDCLHVIADIRARGKWPLLVGGTMLYLKGLLEGLHELPRADIHIRQKIEEESQKIGWEKLHARLMVQDPATAIRIAPSDRQRIGRALEMIEATGTNPSQYYQAERVGIKETTHTIYLWPQTMKGREILRGRIEKRWDLMLQQGLIEEVKRLKSRYTLSLSLPSMRCVGYRQVWQYLAGEIPEDEMTKLAIIATAKLAKRQMTWIRALTENKSAPADNLRHHIILDPTTQSQDTLIQVASDYWAAIQNNETG